MLSFFVDDFLLVFTVPVTAANAEVEINVAAIALINVLVLNMASTNSLSCPSVNKEPTRNRRSMRFSIQNRVNSIK